MRNKLFGQDKILGQGTSDAEKLFQERDDRITSGNTGNSYAIEEERRLHPEEYKRKLMSGEYAADMSFAKGGPIPEQPPMQLGMIRGPGSGTSDSVPATVPEGGFVIPAAVVQAIGPDYFEKIIATVSPQLGAAKGVQAQLSNGEVVIPPEVVKAYGIQFFQQFLEAQPPQLGAQTQMQDGVLHAAAGADLTKPLDQPDYNVLQQSEHMSTNSMRSPSYQVEHSTGARDFVTGLNPDSMRSPDAQRGISEPPQRTSTAPAPTPKADQGPKSESVAQMLIGQRGVEAVKGAVSGVKDAVASAGQSAAQDLGRAKTQLTDDYHNSGYGALGAAKGFLGRGVDQLTGSYTPPVEMAKVSGPTLPNTPTTKPSVVTTPRNDNPWGTTQNVKDAAARDSDYALRALGMLATQDSNAMLSKEVTLPDGSKRYELDPNRVAQRDQFRNDLMSTLSPEQKMQYESQATAQAQQDTLQRRMDVAHTNGLHNLESRRADAPFDQYLSQLQKEGEVRLGMAKKLWDTERSASSLPVQVESKFGPHGEVMTVANQPTWKPAQSADAVTPRSFYADTQAKSGKISANEYTAVKGDDGTVTQVPVRGPAADAYNQQQSQRANEDRMSATAFQLAQNPDQAGSPQLMQEVKAWMQTPQYKAWLSSQQPTR